MRTAASAPLKASKGLVGSFQPFRIQSRRKATVLSVLNPHRVKAILTSPSRASEGYENHDDGPQKTDPVDIKLTDDTHEHEDAPNVDLDTFNDLVAEVKSVIRS